MGTFTDFDPRLQTAQTITDEKVSVRKPIPNTALYEGWVVGLTSALVLGSSHPTFGAFSAAARGGTHYTIIKEGNPTGTNILWELHSGRIISNASIDIYVTYPFFGRILKYWEIARKEFSLGSLLCRFAVDTQILDIPLSLFDLAIVAAEIQLDGNADSNAVFKLGKNNVAGGLIATLTATAGNYTTYEIFFDRKLLNKDDHLILSCNANAAGTAVATRLIVFLG